MIRLGTRGSDLALRQSGMVADKLRAAGHRVELVIIETRGDASDRPFREMEGKAFFTKELDEALLSKQVDLAIHSLKDLPTEDPAGLVTLCVLPRADPRDALLLSRKIALGRDASGRATLPRGTRLGTSSARRFAQLEEAFPGVKVADLRGNVPTRVAKLRRGDYDGILIAAAGIERLGLDLGDLTVLPLDPPQFLPAPGQGVLAARTRADEHRLAATLKTLVDDDAAVCARAERKLLEKLDGGCSLPLGALARRVGRKIVLDAALARDGAMLRTHVETADPDAAAEFAAAAFAPRISPGSSSPGSSSRGPASPATAADSLDPVDPLDPVEMIELAPMVPAVIVTRPDNLDHDLAQTLRERGHAVLSQPAIRFEKLAVNDDLCATMRVLDQFDVVAFTSRQAVRAFARAARQISAPVDLIRSIAALGPGTASELERHEMHPRIRADGSGGIALAEELVRLLGAEARVLHPGSVDPEPAFAERLERARIRVTPMPLYATRAVADDPTLPPGPIIALLSSPSAARAFVARPNIRERLDEKPPWLLLVAGGATTAAELVKLGRPAAAQARSPKFDDQIVAVDAAVMQLARNVSA